MSDTSQHDGGDVDARVTVIVVSYCHAAYVEEALESIRAQTLPPQRVIVIDDASADGSADVIRAWVNRTGAGYDVLVHETNTGLCAGLNEALAMVETPLYTYISADDRMAPQRLERQVAAWVSDGGRAVGVYSNARRIDEAGREILPDYRTLHEWPSEPGALEGDLHTRLLRQCWLPAASVLVSTDAVRAVGGYDERWFFEDYDLWLRLAARGRFLVVEEPLVDFREVSTSLGTTRFRDDDVGFLSARVGIYAKQVGVSAEGDAYIRRVMPPLAIRLWQAGGDPALVLDAFDKATAIMPSRTLRWRAALVRAGARKQPAVLTMMSSVAARVRGTAIRFLGSSCSTRSAGCPVSCATSSKSLSMCGRCQVFNRH